MEGKTVQWAHIIADLSLRKDFPKLRNVEDKAVSATFAPIDPRRIAMTKGFQKANL